VEFDDMLQFEPKENAQDADNTTNIILESLSPNHIPSGQSSSQSNSNIISSGQFEQAVGTQLPILNKRRNRPQTANR
jgi:hypothetical protein